MIRKIMLFSLLPISVNAHDSSLSHFQGNFIAECFHIISQAHHAYGGLAMAIVLFALGVYTFYQLDKVRSLRQKRAATRQNK